MPKERTSIIFAEVTVGNDKRPATLAEAEEVSILMGGRLAEDIDPENGCFNIGVGIKWVTTLAEKGSLEEKFTLKSGLEARLDACWI